MFDFDSALGVSVYGDDLVLAAVSKGLQGYTLKSLEVVAGYAALEPLGLQAKIAAYTQSNRINRENVILGIPRDQVVIRQIELPLEVEENLRQVVQFQIDKLEPGEEDASWSDHVVLARNEKTKSISLQIFMAPAERIGAWLKLFRELDLFPAAVRPASVGYHQVFMAHRSGLSEEPNLVLDLGDQALEIVSAGGSDACFAQRVQWQGEEATFEAALNHLDDFVCRLRLPVEGVRQIYLTGCRAEEMLERFQARFGSGQLLENGLKLKTDDDSTGRIPGLAQAVGLAVSGLEKSTLSRLNLIPEDRRETGQRPSFVPTLALAALLLVILVAFSTRESFQRERRLAAFQEEIAKLRPQQEKVMSLRKEVDARLKEAEELQTMMTGRQSVLMVLKELTEKIPEDAYLQSLSIQRDKVNMTGFSDSATGLATILQSSEYLKKVEPRYITRDVRSGKERFNFEALVQEPGVPVAP